MNISSLVHGRSIKRIESKMIITLGEISNWPHWRDLEMTDRIQPEMIASIT
jgi:hypothetical protein